jgi:hypothetical protein
VSGPMPGTKWAKLREWDRQPVADIPTDELWLHGLALPPFQLAASNAELRRVVAQQAPRVARALAALDREPTPDLGEGEG